MIKKSGKAYCIYCGSMRPYFVIERVARCVVDGTRVRCRRKTARCTYCLRQVYVPEINDENAGREYTAYALQKYGKR